MYYREGAVDGLRERLFERDEAGVRVHVEGSHRGRTAHQLIGDLVLSHNTQIYTIVVGLPTNS